jgi:hypothetical protein
VDGLELGVGHRRLNEGWMVVAGDVAAQISEKTGNHVRRWRNVVRRAWCHPASSDPVLCGADHPAEAFVPGAGQQPAMQFQHIFGGDVQGAGVAQGRLHGPDVAKNRMRRVVACLESRTFRDVGFRQPPDVDLQPLDEGAGHNRSDLLAM